MEHFDESETVNLDVDYVNNLVDTLGYRHLFDPQAPRENTRAMPSSERPVLRSSPRTAQVKLEPQPPRAIAQDAMIEPQPKEQPPPLPSRRGKGQKSKVWKQQSILEETSTVGPSSSKINPHPDEAVFKKPFDVVRSSISKSFKSPMLGGLVEEEKPLEPPPISKLEALVIPDSLLDDEDEDDSESQALLELGKNMDKLEKLDAELQDPTDLISAEPIATQTDNINRDIDSPEEPNTPSPAAGSSKAASARAKKKKTAKIMVENAKEEEEKPKMEEAKEEIQKKPLHSILRVATTLSKIKRDSMESKVEIVKKDHKQPEAKEDEQEADNMNMEVELPWTPQETREKMNKNLEDQEEKLENENLKKKRRVQFAEPLTPKNTPERIKSPLPESPVAVKKVGDPSNKFSTWAKQMIVVCGKDKNAFTGFVIGCNGIKRMPVGEKDVEGIVAINDLPKNAAVVEIVGNIRLPEESELDHYFFNPHVFIYDGLGDSKDDRLCIDSTKIANDGRCVRRLCAPNAVIRHMVLDGEVKFFVVTTREIKKGNEVFVPFDCGFKPISADSCHCQVLEECRIFIKDFRGPGHRQSLQEAPINKKNQKQETKVSSAPNPKNASTTIEKISPVLPKTARSCVPKKPGRKSELGELLRLQTDFKLPDSKNPRPTPEERKIRFLPTNSTAVANGAQKEQKAHKRKPNAFASVAGTVVTSKMPNPKRNQSVPNRSVPPPAKMPRLDVAAETPSTQKARSRAKKNGNAKIDLRDQIQEAIPLFMKQLKKSEFTLPRGTKKNKKKNATDSLSSPAGSFAPSTAGSSQRRASILAPASSASTSSRSRTVVPRYSMDFSESPLTSGLGSSKNTYIPPARDALD